MRSNKMVSAVVAAGLLALAPSGALAAKHHAKASLPGGCRLTINVAPRNVPAGESAEVFGQLICGHAATKSVSGQTITITQKSLGTPSTAIGPATTDEHGVYRLVTSPLQANSSFAASGDGVRSGRRHVVVAPRVLLSTPPTPAEGTQLFTGVGPVFVVQNRQLAKINNRIEFSGTVTPSEFGAEVILERQNAVRGEAWHWIDRGHVGPQGSFSIKHTFSVPGDSNIRVLVRPFHSHGAAVSESRSYEVSQTQNPQLTIASQTNPLVYGQTTTISGTLGEGTSAAVAGTPVTLLAQTRTHHGFAPIANGTTGPGGQYQFPAQAPLQSTFYRVSAGGKLSAVLYEGVKYGLSVTAPASSAAIGAPVTFSGAVTPGRTGHVVYLEAEYPSGIGFYVIQVAALNPPAIPGGPATFSLSHAFYSAAAGAKKVRIKVPGDPENVSSVSPVFDIALAPSPVLAPEPPGNSSQPQTGKV